VDVYEKSLRAVMGEWKEGKTVWGGGVQYRNQTALVPPWMKQSAFPTIIASLTPKDISIAVGGSLGRDVIGNPATPADYRAAAFRSLGNGLYHIAPDPKYPNNVLRDEDGDWIVFDLGLLREELQARRPDDVK
jgi:hypothetical protein